MPDNFSQWEAHEAKHEAWLNTRPVCCHCGEPIQDERMFDINGNYYHVDCAEDEFKKYTDDYCE